MGTRLFGTSDGWDWELMYQFGRFAHGDIRAWSAASNTGYTFEDMPYSEFFPGSFIDDTGPSKTVHFVGAELQLQF